MRLSSLLTTFLLALTSALTLAAQRPACTVEKGFATCDQARFAKALTSARTATYNRATLDAVNAKQLSAMLVSLGKQVVASGQPADLIFDLSQPDSSGVFVGPSGVDRARLRVYGPGPRGPLLWEEIYQDQPDVPWPSAVLYLLQQFKTRFGHS